MVKELVEQHNIDPNGEYYDCAPPHCTHAIDMIEYELCPSHIPNKLLLNFHCA